MLGAAKDLPGVPTDERSFRAARLRMTGRILRDDRLAVALPETGGRIMIVDADAHVIETDATWEFITEEDLAAAPVAASGRDAKGQEHSYWTIDGKARPPGG